MPDLLEAALELAKQGVEVFPLGGDKKPRTLHGFHDATRSPEVISKWNWNSDGAIGAAIPEGHFVVDVDPRHGGDNTARALAKVGRGFPATKVVATKSGGSHRYYKLPEHLNGRKLRGTLGPGIDIKASGKGYVVVPPSPGYALKFDTPVAEAPQWMVEELLVPESSEVEKLASPPKFFAWDKGTAYGLSAMEQELKDLASTGEGNRNNALNRSAFSLAQLVAGGELDEEEAIRRLDAAALLTGLEPAEIKQTIKSGWSAGLMDPRQAPPSERTSYEQFASTSSSDDDFYWLNWEVEEQPPPFYLHPIIPKHAYVLVYGATESSKSIVFLALAAQASHLGVKSSIYSLENPSHIDRDRARRLAPNPANFRITNQHTDINDIRQLNDLVERNRPGGVGSWDDGKGTDWLIIDTYSHAFHSRSEDGNARAIEFARRVRYIMHEVGCTVILIDHTGYSDHNEPRDASAKRQQVDVALFMEKNGQWAPGAPAKFMMTNRKSARFANPFFLRGEIRDCRLEERGLELAWTVARGEQSPEWHVGK